MEYLNKVLGIKVTYEDVEFKHLPNFIVMRYRLFPPEPAACDRL